ncbi:MAG: RdgB/HAM1 family non-canonical purine NTP pyrophosphatase [Chthoniobacterales bacterium]
MTAQQIILATRNAHKAREFRELLGDDFEVSDLGAFPGINVAHEIGRTFEENARLKALAVSQQQLVGAARGAIRTSQRDVPTHVLADDSGLEVDALGGAPGIRSARYAGEGATDEQNIEKLLRELARVGAREISQRTARFHCVLALVRAGRILDTFSGVVEGAIVDLPRGSCGFGYDPVFLPNGLDRTFGELPAKVKNAISHRARAVGALRAAVLTGERSQGLGGAGGGGPPD